MGSCRNELEWKPMKMNARKRRIAVLGAVTSFVLFFLSVHAEEPLGTFGGAGGVAREAEVRALNAPRPAKEAALPKIAPTAPAKSKAGRRLDVARKLGPVRGVRVYGSREFGQRVKLDEQILALLEGDEVRTVGDVQKALKTVQQNLMNQGFYLVQLSLSNKDTYIKEDGTVGVLVDEGRFGELTLHFYGDGVVTNGSEVVEGEGASKRDDGMWYSRDQLLRRFRKIKTGETFDYARFRSVLADVNAHPDLVVDTSIAVRRNFEGDKESNDRRIARYADLELTVSEAFPFHAIWEVNNYGMEEIDEWQTTLTLQYLNLTKHDDVLTVSPSISFNGELMSLAGSYLLPHHWWQGGNTTLYGGWSYLDTDNVVPSLDLEGIGWFLGLQHSEYLVENDNHLLMASAGLLWRYIEDQYTAYGYSLNKRDVSVMPVSLALSYTRRKPDVLGGRNFATLQPLICAATAGDKLNEMWTDADDNYWILRWQLARLQPLFGWYDTERKQNLHQWTLFSKLEGQVTSDVLIPTEKLALGGYNTVRGYHSRGYLGDSGVYGTFELRTPILVDACASLFSDREGKSPFDRIQGVVFTDYGYTRYNDLPSGYDDDEWLWSVGFGLRSAMTKYCQARLDVGVPCHDGNNKEDDDVEVYFSVQFQY